MQIASILGSAGLKLVPDVVMGEGRSTLADVLLARMAATAATNHRAAEVPAVIVSAPNGTNGVSKT